MEDWKIKVGLWECKNMYGLAEEEEMLPFLPRVNDVFWMSDACEERLRKRLRKCLKEHGCGDGCPFTNEKGKTDIKDEVMVHEVFFQGRRPRGRADVEKGRQCYMGSIRKRLRRTDGWKLRK